MRSNWLIVLSLILSLSIITLPAEARRFGGGFKNYSRSSQRSFFSGARKNNTYDPKRNIRRSAIKGAAMGFLAGSLIGSLLYGHGFGGFQLIDLFLLFGIGYFLYRKFIQSSRPQVIRRDEY